MIVFGHPTLSRPVNRLLSRADVELVVVGDGSSWVDPGWRASVVTGKVEPAPGDQAWLARWQRADAERSTALDATLAGVAGLSGADLAEGRVGEAGAVFANRGLAGIDGTVATAMGIALATGEPTTLLCGDLTFLHDLNGLATGAGERRPSLRIVVADDGGGSIFATLEYGDERFADAFERVFATPSGVDLAAAAAAHGVPVTRVGDEASLAAALARPREGVDVIVVGLDRGGRRALHEALSRA